jgi:hypothetical protein
LPNETPLGIGSIPYPQYSFVRTDVIKQSVAITKGLIYTPDAEGRLIVPVSTSGIADLTNGVFQPLADVTAPAAEDTDKVQGMIGGSYIILKAPANLVVGEEVELGSSGSTTDQDKCKLAVHPHTEGFLGRIKEIYTKGTDGAIKQKTADDDLVVIEVVGTA